jgi:serine/threonine-protein kinase
VDEKQLQLVGPLVACGALPQAEANECLQIWQKLLKQGQKVSLLQVLVKKGLMTRTQALVLLGKPLEEHQPFDQYRLLRKVGEGGMADVYEATFEPLQARVALKILKTEFALQERYRLRFKREAAILLNLDHPNIVEAREHKSQDGIDFYAMGFVDGISVLDFLNHGIAMGEGLALHVAVQAGSALQHMHERGVVHRDIKPGNLVVDPDGTLHIIDFGLAKLMQGMREDTAEAMTVGTPEYMSPEQARGVAHVDTRSDIYSLGVSLFHMLTNELPFTGTPEEILIQQVKQDVEFTAEQMTHMSASVQFVIRKAMAKDPGLRYATPQEMVDDIQAVAGDLIAARSPVPSIVGESGIEAAPIDAPPPPSQPRFDAPTPTLRRGARGPRKGGGRRRGKR